MKNFDNIRDDIMNSIENRVRQAYNKGYNDGQKDILEQSICKVTENQKAYREGYENGYANCKDDNKWKPHYDDQLKNLVPAIDVLDNMLDTLTLDKPSRDAIREFVTKYTIFVTDLANYGIVAYNKSFENNKLFVDDEDILNENSKKTNS